MLNRTSLTTPDLPLHWGALLRGLLTGRLLTGPNAWLLQLTLIAVMVSLMACIYLWQSSELRDIQEDTRITELKLSALERQNVSLMLQVAQWNRPAYIEEKARRQGMAPAEVFLVMRVPQPMQAPSASRSDASRVASRWQQWIELLPAPRAVIQVAAWMR
jgi:cell division protein FtsL